MLISRICIWFVSLCLFYLVMIIMVCDGSMMVTVEMTIIIFIICMDIHILYHQWILYLLYWCGTGNRWLYSLWWGFFSNLVDGGCCDSYLLFLALFCGKHAVVNYEGLIASCCDMLVSFSMVKWISMILTNP